MDGNLKTTDDLLAVLGTGKWNMLCFIAVSLWLGLIPPQALSGAFLSPALTPTCRPPAHRNITAVADDSCSYTYLAGSGEMVEEPCTEWDFDTSVYSSSITADFGLVCGREYLRATYTSIFMIGNFISPVLGGYLADRYGRWPVVVVSLVVFTLGGITIVFLHSLPLIFIARFLIGASNLPTFYVLAMEVCENRLRAVVGIVVALPWALGTMAYGAVAYLIRDWRWLQLACTLPNLIILPLLWFVDESPRWLMVRGHHEKALRVLHRAARWNKATLPPDTELRALMEKIRQEVDDSEKPLTKDKEEEKNRGCRRFLSVPDLCRPGVRRVTVIMCLNFFTSSMVFYGLNLNGANLSTNPYLYLVLGGLMEVPAYSLTAPLISRLGRKKPTVAGYFLCGAAILALAFIPMDVFWLVMTLAMLGKMCISAVYQILYVYITELMPTEVRIQGLGAAKVSSRIGSMLSAYVTDLMGQAAGWAPSVVFGGISVLTGVVTLWAAETKGMPLPDTISHIQKGAKTSERNGEGADEEMVNLKGSCPGPDPPAV